MKKYLTCVASGEVLGEDDAEAAFGLIMSGAATQAQIGGFLMALRVRGEAVSEIVGAVRAMRNAAIAVEAPPGAIDTCGTGGDGAATFNISTAAALVVAACGVPVAKHGNRAVSSKSGSADVLAALGVRLDAPAALAPIALREAGIGFLMAPNHHAAVAAVGSARAELGTRTIFNLLGPLANPAGTRRQVVGVFAQKWIVPMAEALGRLGAERAWVVHGSDGLDELTTTSLSHVAELRDGNIRCFEVEPESAGLRRAGAEELTGGDAATNAAAMVALLDGQAGAYRDVVLLNAAAALVVADKAANLSDGVKLAARAIDGGDAKTTLARLVAVTNRPWSPE